MSFISLPYEFDPESGACRSFQIALHADGEIVPVGFLRRQDSLPVDLQKLSENMAAMLNGHAPLHQIGDTHAMYYERHAAGMNFRFRESRIGGVSILGAMFTSLPGIELEFEDETAH